MEPLAVLGAIHLKHITDLAWSADGAYLLATSHDGYCTVAAFAEGELGRVSGVASDKARQIREQIAAKRAPNVCFTHPARLLHR